MHFCAFVITDFKPDAFTIEKLMAPYRGEKFETFQVGGRWTGYLTEYEPTRDPKNYNKCDTCGGSTLKPTTNEKQVGKYSHNDKLQVAHFQEDDNRRVTSDKLCTDCDGQGKILKPVVEWVPYDGDMQPIHKVSFHKKPRAVVVNGKWTEGQFRDLYDQLPVNHWLTVVDCSTR